jgi:hypothetical protein
MRPPDRPLAIDHVEWLSAFWQLTEEGEPASANADLLTLLRFIPRLRAEPAVHGVARLRRRHSRDHAIKAVVHAAYRDATDKPERSDLLEAFALLDAFAARREDVLGRGPDGVIQDARTEAQRRVEELAGQLDPAADLAGLTGERLPLRVVLAPSVFLPPPQAGRHGVLVHRGDEWIAHLHFGFPLRQNPQQFNITRPWLLGGAWHYAIDLYLQRYWPAIARQLTDQRELALAVSAAMGSPDRAAQPWPAIVHAHVNVALKCVLARRLGVPDGAHRAFARARGLVLFPWFVEWLLDREVVGTALTAHIMGLPEALAAAQPRLETLAGSASAAPPTVNLALISPSNQRACLVVPDEWPDDIAAAAVCGWRLFPWPLVRYGEWLRAHTNAAAPVIAFGEPERNPLVRRVLEQRGLSLRGVDAADPAIIALSMPGFEDALWCVAVAVTRPETSAAIHMETALRQTGAYIILNRGAVVDVGRVPLDQ